MKIYESNLRQKPKYCQTIEPTNVQNGDTWLHLIEGKIRVYVDGEWYPEYSG